MSIDGRSGMFSAILIHASSNRSHMLRYLVASADCVEVQRDFEHTPNEHELTRLLASMTPEVVIVDLGTMEAMGVALTVRALAPLHRHHRLRSQPGGCRNGAQGWLRRYARC